MTVFVLVRLADGSCWRTNNIVTAEEFSRDDEYLVLQCIHPEVLNSDGYGSRSEVPEYESLFQTKGEEFP